MPHAAEADALGIFSHMVRSHHSVPPTLLMPWCLPLFLAVNSCTLRPTWSGASAYWGSPLALSCAQHRCPGMNASCKVPPELLCLLFLLGHSLIPDTCHACVLKSLSLSGGPLSLITPGHIGSSVFLSSLMLFHHASITFAHTPHPTPCL